LQALDSSDEDYRDPFKDETERDYILKDYKRFLKQKAKARPNTVNAALVPPTTSTSSSFYNTGIIERWGTGTIRMAEELMAQGLPPPNFDTSTPNNFILISSNSGFTAADSLSTDELNERQRKALKFLSLGIL
jgi:hypothetical protein